MSRIHGADTKPEKVVRSLLYGMGYRFRIRNRKLPGNPDIVLPKYKMAIFVHGCFWHRHPNCKFAYTPKSRIDFWQKKFLENTDRDRKTEIRLRETGWNIVIVWECQTADLHLLRQRLGTEIRKRPCAPLKFSTDKAEVPAKKRQGDFKERFTIQKTPSHRGPL